MSIKRKLAEAAEQARDRQDGVMMGLIEEVHAFEWTCRISYLDPSKGQVVNVDDVPLPNNGGTGLRTALPKPGDMVSFAFFSGSLDVPVILSLYTVHNLQVDENYLTMGNLLGGE